MSTEQAQHSVEYRVVPVTRFVVTRWYEDRNGHGVAERGEFVNFPSAYEVAYALAEAERNCLGWPVDDARMRYPSPIDPQTPKADPRADRTTAYAALDEFQRMLTAMADHAGAVKGGS